MREVAIATSRLFRYSTEGEFTVDSPSTETVTNASSTWVPWDLDALDSDALREAYLDVAAFVDWLRACDIAVPACWYTHGWVVWRLAALLAWQQLAYIAETNPREATDWWLVGLEPLRRDWEELQAHRGRHVPADSPLDDPKPVPPLDDVIAALVAARRTAEDSS